MPEPTGGAWWEWSAGGTALLAAVVAPFKHLHSRIGRAHERIDSTNHNLGILQIAQATHAEKIRTLETNVAESIKIVADTNAKVSEIHSRFVHGSGGET